MMKGQACWAAIGLLVGGYDLTLTVKPTGDWEGESLCVDKVHFPACKDEHVLYHLGSGPDKSGKLTVRADKLVNGKFEWMGDLPLKYNPGKHQISGEFQNKRTHGRWTFDVGDKVMTGILEDVPSKRVVRKIRAQKKP